MLPHIHRFFDDAAEFGQNRLAQHPPEARHPGRRLEQIHWIDPPHGRQEPLDIASKFCLAAGHLTGEQRGREDVVGQFGHVDRDVPHFAIVRRKLVAAGKCAGLLQHLNGKSAGMAGRKHWGDRLARALPDLAFRSQQSVAQDRAQDQLADHRHLVIAGIVDQHMANEAGMIDDKCALAEQFDLEPFQPERRFAPQFKRIAHDRADDLKA